MTPLSPIQAPTPEVTVQTPRSWQAPLDLLLVLAVVGLGVCSIVTLKGVTSELIPGDPHYYIERQGIYLAFGLVLMVGLSRLDYARLRQFKRGLYVVLILSILAVFAFGHTIEGAASERAIQLPLFSFQASELGKVLLTLALAAFIVDRPRQLHDKDTTVRVLLAALVPAMLVIAQPDLGSGLVYMTIAVFVLFVSGTSWKQFASLLALGAVAITIVVFAAPAAGVQALKSYQTERLTAFLHPSTNVEKQGYQQEESKIAIGSGQKTGRGAAANRTQLSFVPEDDTDFIFASVGEQFGFVGAALVLSLYALLIWRTLRIMTMSKDLFGALIAAGVAGMLMFQVFVNVGMAVGIMPITGVTLPLMSYGGSSVLTTLLAVGLLQSIYVRARASEALKGRVPLHG